jgi:hypothetical protein
MGFKDSVPLSHKIRLGRPSFQEFIDIKIDRHNKPNESFDFTPAIGNIYRRGTQINRPVKGRKEGGEEV